MNAVTITGNTPLHLALCGSYHEDLIKFLISKGVCDLTLQNDEGKLPLHIACEKYSEKVVRLIGECDLNAKTSSGDTPLHIVCRRKSYMYHGENFEAEIMKIVSTW